MLIAGVGLAMLVLVPLVWGLLRRHQGLPMFGAPDGRRARGPGVRPGLVGMNRQHRRPTTRDRDATSRLLARFAAATRARLAMCAAVPTRGPRHLMSRTTDPRRLPAEPARPAGGGVDPHLPRGRRRVREAGPDVLGRQGLHRHAPPGGEGVLPREDPVPGAAGRHRLRLPRGARPAATTGSTGSASAWSSPASRRRSPTASSSTTARPAATGCRSAPCSTPSRRRASPPPSVAAAATRRRPAPRSASTPTATSSASGTPRCSAPSCGASTTAGSTRASTCGSSRCPTGPSSTSGTTSAARSIEIPSIYFSHQRRVFERDGMLLTESEFNPLPQAARPSRSAPSASAPSAT